MKVIDDKKIYTVSEVNYFARQTLEQMVFWVEGEISRCDRSPGYNFFYITLKDEYTVLPAVADGSVIMNLKGDPVGQKVLVYGHLSLYEARGQYQLKIYRVEQAGAGLLQRKLQETILRLRSEGLFDNKYKKDIPTFPKRVCLVTSYGSDAWYDFKKHSMDKFPIIELYTADIRVQGTKSTPQLLKVLPNVDKGDFDVIVISRGGGSVEDLAAFNDEEVARAIFKMKTPIIVAIGHEANESLAEWVADRRASTPTDAANIVTFGYANILEKLQDIGQQLRFRTEYYFSTNLQKLDYIYLGLTGAKKSFRDLPYKLNTLRELLRKHEKYLIVDAKAKNAELFQAIKNRAKLLKRNNEQTLANLQKMLLLLSPRNTLKRGYSIAKDGQGNILRSVKSVVLESKIGVILSDGRLSAQVKSINENGQKIR